MVTEEKSYYDVLRIESDADASEIKSAYYKLIREFTNEKHPEEFKEIRKAYEVLSNEEEKLEYDRILNTDIEQLDALNYIYELIEDENYEEAKLAVKKQVVLSGKSAYLYILLAKCEYNLRNYVQVLEVISKIENPTSLEQEHIYGYAAYSNLYLEKYSDAEAFGLKLLEVDFESSRFYSLLGDIYLGQGKYDKFGALLEKMIKQAHLTVEHVPFLINGFMIQDSYTVSKESLVKLKDTIARLGKSKTDRLNIIRLIINEMESYDLEYVYTGFYDLCELITALNQEKDDEITEYVQGIFDRLPDRVIEENMQEENRVKKYTEDTHGNKTKNEVVQEDGPGGWTLMIAIVLGFVLSIAATPFIGIPAALIYYSYAKYIWIILGVVFVLLFMLIGVSSSL